MPYIKIVEAVLEENLGFFIGKVLEKAHDDMPEAKECICVYPLKAFSSYPMIAGDWPVDSVPDFPNKSGKKIYYKSAA